MKKVILGVLFLGMALFAKCDFSDGAVNSVAECPEVMCLPNATVVEDGCCVVPAPVVVGCTSCCAAVVSTPPCVVILD